MNLAKTYTSIVPQFIREVVIDTNHGPITEALFHNLANPKLEQPTFVALLR